MTRCAGRSGCGGQPRGTLHSSRFLGTLPDLRPAIGQELLAVVGSIRRRGRSIRAIRRGRRVCSLVIGWWGRWDGRNRGRLGMPVGPELTAWVGVLVRSGGRGLLVGGHAHVPPDGVRWVGSPDRVESSFGWVLPGCGIAVRPLPRLIHRRRFTVLCWSRDGTAPACLARG
jgi:hypothetical protein